MSSKLDPHVDLICRQLLAGSTYINVVENLNLHGCVTTVSGVREYIVRRSKKIKLRSSLIYPKIPVLSVPVLSVRKIEPAILEPATYLDLYL